MGGTYHGYLLYEYTVKNQVEMSHQYLVSPLVCGHTYITLVGISHSFISGKRVCCSLTLRIEYFVYKIVLLQTELKTMWKRVFQ